MAWSYRRRIKVAPGVHLNISKSGVSTSYGMKGMSITTGPRGTYLNTSIPGTGLYNRQKIDSGTSSSMDANYDTPDGERPKIINDGGKGCGIMLLFLLFWLALAGAGYYAYDHYYKGAPKTENVDNLFPDESTESLDETQPNNYSRFQKAIQDPAVLGLTALAIVCLVAGIVLDRKGKKKTNPQDEADSIVDQHSSTTNDEKKSYNEEDLRNLIDGCKYNPLKQKLLKSILGQSLLTDADEKYRPLIEEDQKRIAQADTEENQALLQQHEKEYKQLKEEAEGLIYNVDDELTSEEALAYSRFANHFETFLFKTGSRKWRISYLIEDKVNPMVCLHMSREETQFAAGGLSVIPSRYPIPCFQYSDTGWIMIYPRFVIDIDSLSLEKMYVYPLSKVSLKYKRIVFLEDKDPTAASGANIVGNHYLHSTKDGGRDYRYSYNPSKPIVEYHPFTISIQLNSSTINHTFLNNSDDGSWEHYFNELKDVYTKVMQVERIENAIPKLDPNLKQNYDEQFYYELLSIVQRFDSFYRRLSENQKFSDLLLEWAKAIPELAETNQSSSEVVRFAIYSDIIRCYHGTGYEINLKSNEGLGLMLFYALTDPSGSMPLEYETMNKVYELYLDKATEYTKTVEAYASKDSDFLIEKYLNNAEFSPQLHDNYVLFLHKLSSIIAKEDKTISDSEANTLNSIMSLRLMGEKEHVKAGEVKAEEVVNDALPDAAGQLNALIGLASVKEEIKALASFVKVQKMREKKGMKTSPISYHCVFTGNPGTGKTTVARIVSEIYKELGILKKGHLVETDRSGLVAEYVGQTSVKTNKIIDSALDGILFIDEAYSLVDGGSSDYGKEAISTLLKRMEDDRDRLVVILAGYTDDMKRFIDSNPGLQSRFNRYIEFPDYSPEELLRIFVSMTEKYEYHLSGDAIVVLQNAFEQAVATKDKNFGNGRYVRNLYEKIIEHQATRISKQVKVSSSSLATIEAEDVKAVLEKQ